MASLGHLAVGLAAARMYSPSRTASRPRLAAVAFWSLLSLLPDADVIGFPLGVRYEDAWGHRGATHSFVFSLALGAAIGLLAPRFGRPRLRTAATATAVLVSHALLDTLTDGGLGCALFWPFDLTRYFAPWNPIPVAPIGLAYFSPYGLMVAAVEVVIFAPLLWVGLARRRRSPASPARRWTANALLLALWAAGLLLFASEGGAREEFVGTVIREDTEYAAGFSDERLTTIVPGEDEAQVRARLGEPFHEILIYPDTAESCAMVYVDEGRVIWTRPAARCGAAGVERGQAATAVTGRLGPPNARCWLYSRSPARWYYRVRAVCFEDARVANVVRLWFRD